MSFINHAASEINCKIVYYGAGMSGKTTNIQYIYEHTRDDRRGELVSLDGDNERTLFFDFLPLSVGEVRGYKTRFHLYTIPGQTFYDISREFLIKGVDGIVFVVDSRPERMEANIQAFDSLTKILTRQGYALNELPVVIQYNKRDASSVATVEELESTFNQMKKPKFSAVALRGEGVMETLQELSQMIIRDLKGGKQA